MSSALEQLIADGSHAFERGDGPASRRAFQAALDERECGEALEGLARALYLEIEYRASIETHERAYTLYRTEGDNQGASRCARILGWMYINLYGDFAVANGWVARACTVLETAEPPGSEPGWIEVLRAMTDDDATRRPERYRVALAIGREHGDVDLEFEALGRLGLELVLLDQTAAGMPLLDEALAAVCAGEVRDLYVMEGVFCGMFWACERSHDVARAEQWLRAADQIVARRGLTAVGGFCRAHYGSILTAAGRWREADQHLTEAARIAERGYTAARTDVLLRLAYLRVRQGRLEEAALLMEGLEHHPDAVRPLATLHLAHGEVERARELLERALAPDGLGASVAPLLSLQVEAHLAAGAIEQATRCAEQLTTLAATYGTAYLRACAALARGSVCIASGTGDPRACLHEALSAFGLAQMPVEAARARLELARAVAAERPAVAVAEARAAFVAFERFEARRDADAAAALLRSLGAHGRGGPRLHAQLTRRELEVLDLLAHGLSNAEIGERLSISAKTVEHHVGRILSKLEVRNRAEAVAYGLRTSDGQPGPSGSK